MSKWFNRENAFLVISLSIAILFGWGFFLAAGFPPTKVGSNWQLLLVFMIFLIIPFAKKLDFFQLFSFEAKIDEVRKELGETKEKISDVREDVRHMISQQNVLSASVQSANLQAVTVNNYVRPPQELVEAAAAGVADVAPIERGESDPLYEPLSVDSKLMKAIFGIPEAGPPPNNQLGVLADLFTNFEDFNEVRKLNMSEQVAILRIRVERELKRLLKPVTEEPSQNFEIARKFNASTSQLVKKVMVLHPELRRQKDSFDVFFRIANSAVHADEVPYKDLETATYLGERLLGLLAKLECTGTQNWTDDG